MQPQDVINYLESFQIMGNSGMNIVIAAILFCLSFAIFYIIKYSVMGFLKKHAERTTNTIDDAFVSFFEQIKFLFFAYLALYIALKSLLLPDIVNQVADGILVVIIIYYAIKAIGNVIDYFVNSTIEKRRKLNKEENTSLIIVLGKIVKMIVWVLAILLLLSNLGWDITSLVAGVGVAGIAIAFALQKVLEDLFASVSIYFDKPFQEGDFIIVGTDMGVVKHIGLKSTRIQALQGQEIVMSNRELTSVRINNYKKMKKRRIVFGFGIEYGTPTQKMKKINEIVKKTINKIPDCELDRTHFKEFGDSALIYEVVYYLDSGDYNRYMDAQQEINFGLKDELKKIKVSMAFPTRTIHMVKG